MTVSASGRAVAFFFILIAFVLFLLVSISTPVTSNLQFLSYRINGTKELRIGMWGSCVWDVASSGVLVNKNCTRGTLPVLVDLRNLPGNTSQANPFVGGKLSIPLVLYPIAAGLAFLGIITSVISSPLGILNCQGAFGLSGAAMVIHFILFERTDTQVHQRFTSNLKGGLSNCVWIGLAGMIAAGLATLACIVGSAKETRVHGSLIKEGGERKGKRREFDEEEY